MKNIWIKIAGIGLNDQMDPFLKKRVKLTNQIVFSISAIALFYVFVFYAVGLKELSYITTAIPLLFATCLILNHYKHYHAGRLLFLLSVNFSVFLYCYFLGADSAMGITFFSLSLMPWLLFEIKDWKYILGGTVISTSLFYTFYFSDPTSIMGIEPSVQHILALSFYGMSFFVCALCIGFMSFQNSVSEHAMNYANNRMTVLLHQVQDQRDKLESQQEELRQNNEELAHQTEELRASEEELRIQEEELRQINVELEEKSESLELSGIELQKKTVELEAANKYKSEFLANMSHELRTPLNSVLILANLLKENSTANLNAKQIEYAGIIHKSGTDLLNLINDILDLSKIEAGKADFHLEEVKVSELILDMEQLFTVLADQKKVNFVIDLGTNTPETIITDKIRLEQVLKNLLSNAFKFTPEKGKITIGFNAHEQGLVVSVSDTGIGIPADKQQLIFEAFQQADGSTSRRYGGTGLGLSISKELVGRLGGKMYVDSKPGAGSTFTIYLPVDASSVSQKAHTPPLAVSHTVPEVNFLAVKEQTIVKDDKSDIKIGLKSILIIEDDIVFAQLVNDFAKGKGYKTIVAVSGDEGIFYAKKYRPSAIILDLGLPIIDGRNILKILKSDDELKTIPVHVITSEDRTDFAVDQVESFFIKPLIRNELELTFTSIESYIHEHYKNILLLLSNNLQLKNMFESLTSEIDSEIMYDIAENSEQAIEILTNKGSDCVIVDIGDKIEKGINTVKELRNAAQKDTHMIVYLEGDISSADEKLLKTYADSIIRKSVQAKGRLLDEVELFLHKINNHSTPAIPEKYSGNMDKSLAGKKVLLVDDDMRNIFALTALLESQGMSVIAAENGKESLEMLKTNSDVDIVLMDIMMPEMDGYEAMYRIRNDMHELKLPIIALTAKAMTGDREKCIEAGASDYITKPVDQNKLFSLMRVWLAQ